ncbi:MAG: DUF4390 domain-containing protein [bacterium]
MFKKKLLTVIGIAAFFLSGSFSPVIAFDSSEVRITTLEIKSEKGIISAQAGLQINLDQIKEYLMSGTETKISYYFELFRERSYWLDSEEASAQLDYTVKYDNIKKQFGLLMVTGKTQTTVHPKDFDRLKELLTTVKDCFLASVLPPGKYYLQAKARMSSLGDPSMFDYLLNFFYSFDEFDTSWATSLPQIIPAR